MSNSTAAGLPPREVQKLLISSNLNSSMLFNLMMGVYTMVYVGTIYLYFTKRGPSFQRHVVVTAITFLYILCICIFAIEWYFLQWSMIERGATRASVFIASVSSPIWLMATINTMQNVMIIIADALLIWRCFYVWNRSWRMVIIPLILLITEIGLLVPTAYFRTTVAATTFNRLNSSTLFISAATTIVTTLLIAYRISSAGVFENTGLGFKPGLFKRILEVLIQSAAVYSLAMLVNAVCIAIPTTPDLRSPTLAAETYLELAICIISGLAPTIIVARTVMIDQENTFPSAPSRMTGLRFQGQLSTIQIRTNPGAGAGDHRVHTIDLEMGDADMGSSPTGEGHDLNGKKRASLVESLHKQQTEDLGT